MGSELEEKYKKDMEKALALSMESHALEEMKRKSRGSTVAAPALPPRLEMSQQRRHSEMSQQRRPHAENPPPELPRRNHSVIDVKSRPRPKTNQNQPSTLNLLPPPVREQRQVPVQDQDLMSFNPLPVDQSKKDLFQNLDSLYNTPPALPSRNFMSPQHTPNVQAHQGSMVKSISWTANLNNSPFARSSVPSLKSSTSDYSILSSIPKKTPQDGSLIDLGTVTEEIKVTKVSVLEAFDPLLKIEEDNPDTDDAKMTETENPYQALSDSSFYEAYDPFEYMITKSQNQNLEEESENVYNEPIYATPTKKKHARNASISGPTELTLERRQKQKIEYENVKIMQRKSLANLVNKEGDVANDSEIQAFVEMVTKVRNQFKFSDTKTNLGLVISPKISSSYPEGTQIMIIVHFSRVLSQDNLVKFTCDIGTSVDLIICKALSEISNDFDQYLLQICGISEYLDHDSSLKDYEYVHQCYKFDRDVEFIIVPKSDIKKTFARTAQDDENDSKPQIVDISPLDQIKKVSYEELGILLETLEKECQRVAKMAEQLANCSDKEVMSALRPKQVIQSVKAISTFLGLVETMEISAACDMLSLCCVEFDKAKGNEDPSGKLRPEIVDEVGERYATVILKAVTNIQVEHATKIKTALEKVQDSVKGLIEIYIKSFRVNFSMNSNYQEKETKETIETYETFLAKIFALHRIPVDWNHDEYQVCLQVYHGTRPIMDPSKSLFQSKSDGFFPRVVFDQFLGTESVQICGLPREARLVLTLFARDVITEDKQRKLVTKELGWASLQLFDFQRHLCQGTFLLNLWPSTVEKQVGPAPDCGSHPYADTCPMISLDLPEMPYNIVFPITVPVQSPRRHDYNFNELDYYMQQQLYDICDQDIITFSEMSPVEREVLWEKRYYLSKIPGALPKVLLAANSWDFASLPSLYGLLQNWERPEPMDVLQLFLPCFPDTHVRDMAIKWLLSVSNDDFVDYLPQLLEALKHETWAASPLAKLMLERSLQSARVAHSLYWLLAQSLPGQTPQNTTDNPLDKDTKLKVARYRRRLQMMMRALYTICGDALRKAFVTQQTMLQYLNEAAREVKQSKDSTRHPVLHRHLENLHLHLAEVPTPLPLSIGSIASGIDLKNSSYFPSNTVPLKICFHSNASSDPNSEFNPIIPAIFKVGDDLRQDQLTIQMIRLMNKMWLKEDLDLKMVTFGCVPTGDRQGMVELVTEAKTLREIQVMGNRGVTGSFKDTPISDYLVKHNPSQLEFARAVNNFTRSTAGYSVITYILGICDRHNDNIMVKQSGHMFHIDFGKFLGDAQMIGNFKRDRTPFVLTPDMIYVINGGDKPSQKFHNFVDLCCKAFNIIRKNGNLLLNLFALMASSGIPGVTMDAVSYVQRALLPDLSSSEAAAYFSRLIEESLSSWFTQWNFFFHNLAQKRFSNDENESDGQDGGELLSFIPKSFSMKSDGRITDVLVYGIQKRYEPEKHYVFILKISRENVKAPTYVFRTYKEFCELDSKLHTAFNAMSGCHSLPKGLGLGRQEVHAVAEQRKHEIARFLESLFSLNISISQSDLVYTFFHPLLRDQQDADIHLRKFKENKTRKDRMIKGQLKLSYEYRKDVLHIMICHAKNLAIPDNSKDEPNSYVKVYLKPDPHKATKRKTRVVRKNCHPSFMEMLEYRMPLEVVRCRTLQATVWDCDRFQENMFLGALTISLNDLKPNEETIEWYPLTNFSRMN